MEAGLRNTGTLRGRGPLLYRATGKSPLHLGSLFPFHTLTLPLKVLQTFPSTCHGIVLRGRVQGPCYVLTTAAKTTDSGQRCLHHQQNGIWEILLTNQCSLSGSFSFPLVSGEQSWIGKYMKMSLSKNCGYVTCLCKVPSSILCLTHLTPLISWKSLRH